MDKGDFFTFLRGGEVTEQPSGGYLFSHPEYRGIEVVMDIDGELITWGTELTQYQKRLITEEIESYERI